MSSILPAGKTVQVLENLKGTIEEIAARAGKLSEDFRAQTAREQRRFETALEEQTSSLAAANLEAQTSLENARTTARSNFEKRKSRIGKAYQSSKEKGLQKVEERTGARKYELQKRMLQAERDQQNGLAAAAAAHQQFQNSLASEQEALAQLEVAAQKAFKGYPAFRHRFNRAYASAEGELSADEHRLLAEMRESMTRAASELSRFRGLLLVRVFQFLLLWFALAAAFVASTLLFPQFGIRSLSLKEAGLWAGAGLALVLIVRFIVIRSALPLAGSIAKTLARARRLHGACQQQCEIHYQQESERLKTEYSNSTASVEQQLKQALSHAGDSRVACRMKSDERAVRANNRNERLYPVRLKRIEKEHSEAVQLMHEAAEVRRKALTDAWEQKRSHLSDSYAKQIGDLRAEWTRRLQPLYQSIQGSIAAAEQLFPAWGAAVWKEWRPPSNFVRAASFASLNVEVSELCEKSWDPKELPLPGPDKFVAPVCLVYPEQGSVLIETDSNWGHDHAVGALNNIILRLLSTAPPGRLNFTILDPVGLGQNFAGVMHLADYEEAIINNRIWTQSLQIEEKLSDLNEHMEKVIQMYLRNEYKTIAEYNEQAGVIAEKYHFLVIADFPANFTDVAAKRLLSIAASGSRCGVFTLIHWDHRQPMPQDFIPDELRKSSFTINAKEGSFTLTSKSLTDAALLMDEPPSAEVATDFIQQVGRLSRDSSRVEVPFTHVVPADGKLWTQETTAELRVPIGRTGATKLQYLELGKDTRQHGLIAGKTGSGKSTLFHVIITNLALWCSPEQVEFYLVDFKKGVEFKCYAAKRLPHARVVAIESDREFGLSVLQRIDDELRRRGDLFRKLGVQDLPGYKRAGGKELIPRTLLLVDEFQEFFVEDDKVSQTASLLLDRIVRQGRAFGIHVLLGSQTLGGAYTVARTTLGQMVVRIALQCNEADAYLIMDENNPAPRLLSRPGEGIYNDMAGALEGNSPFQVVWLPDEVRDSFLGKVRNLADQNGEIYPGPIVFEGNAPADVRENSLLRKVLETRPLKPASAGRIWLGAPNSIKGPTEAIFNRQSGSNLLIVGQRDEAILAMLSIGLVSLTPQFPVGAARFVLCDVTPQGTPEREFLEQLVRQNPHAIPMPRPADLPGILKELSEEMKHRAEESDAHSPPPVFLFIHGLQRFSKLRYEEEFAFSSGDAEAEVKPGALLNEMICEGTRLGFHVIATCDTYNNVTRFLSRKALSEFEMRVLFQMSANDSASLIDSPKAGTLGLHRALYFNAQEGYLETFRPYALPANEWFEDVQLKFASLSSETANSAPPR